MKTLKRSPHVVVRIASVALVASALMALVTDAAHSAPLRSILLTPGSPVSRASPDCATDFDSLLAVARRDYAGYQTAAQLRPEALARLTDTVRTATHIAGDTAQCASALAHWLAFFRDGHLGLESVQAQTTAPSGSAPTAAGPDQSRPSLTALDSTTFLLRVPSFELTYKPSIDSLVESATRYARARALILDVRGNGGGGDAAFAAVIPLLYTGPIRIIGADAWASAANAAYFRSLLAIPELPASDRDLVRRLTAEMEQHPNRFVPLDRDTILQMVPPRDAPHVVGVLFDRASGSTTEEFLLQARQSRKTILFSRDRSAGALDYANVRQVLLPSGRWRFRFGTSRSRRLPNSPVDGEGIAPTVQVPSTVQDEMAYVRGYLDARMRP